MTPEAQDLLRRFAISDEGTLEGAMAASDLPVDLDHKSCALVRIAALIASDAEVSSYQWAIDDAMANGSTDAEVVAVLLAVAPIVGLACVAGAAPRLAMALGYDVEQALEG